MALKTIQKTPRRMWLSLLGHIRSMSELCFILIGAAHNAVHPKCFIMARNHIH